MFDTVAVEKVSRAAATCSDTPTRRFAVSSRAVHGILNTSVDVRIREYDFQVHYVQHRTPHKREVLLKVVR